MSPCFAPSTEEGKDGGVRQVLDLGVAAALGALTVSAHARSDLAAAEDADDGHAREHPFDRVRLGVRLVVELLAATVAGDQEGACGRAVRTRSRPRRWASMCNANALFHGF